jgi:serine/threonine-protein kinase
MRHTRTFTRRFPVLLAGPLLFGIALSGSRAVAQTSASDKAAAEALFDQGRKLLAQGNYAEACKRLEQSQRIDPGIGTLLYLGDCYAKSGRTASAWATFREAASEARAEGQTGRAQAGSDRADKLESKLSRLAIGVAPETRSIDGLQIKRGTEVVRPGLFGVPIPVDPGMITVEASAPGYATWKKSVKVGDQADRVTVKVPPLSKTAPAAPAKLPPTDKPPTPAPAPRPEPAPLTPPPADTGTTGSTQRTLGLVVGGAGVIGIGIGSFFGLKAIQKNNDAKDLCPGNRCTSPEGVTLTDDAKSAATISNIAFGAGAAVLATGVVLYLTAPSGQSAALRLQPSVGRAGAGMSLGGRF